MVSIILSASALRPNTLLDHGVIRELKIHPTRIRHRRQRRTSHDAPTHPIRNFSELERNILKVDVIRVFRTILDKS
jgi:hypothetical protein